MNRIEKNLLWSSNLWALSEGMLGPLYAVFAEGIGGDILDISWAWATYLIVTGIGVVIVGKISDKVQKEVLLVAGYGLTAVFTFGYLFVSAPIHLFIIQAGLGIALALSDSPWYALYDKYSGDGKNDGYVWGIADGAWYVISGIALIIGGFIVSNYSFSILFIIMGVIQTIATIYQARLFKLCR